MSLRSELLRGGSTQLWGHFDPDTGDATFETRQDVQAIIDNNKEKQNLGDGYSPSREWRRAASIPLVVVEQWRHDYGVDIFNPNHKDAIRRLLNDIDYLYLRTAAGRL